VSEQHKREKESDYSGKRKDVQQSKCPNCNGLKFVPCEDCKKTGKINGKTCNKCDGKGGRRCNPCNATGFILGR